MLMRPVIPEWKNVESPITPTTFFLFLSSFIASCIPYAFPILAPISTHVSRAFKGGSAPRV